MDLIKSEQVMFIFQIRPFEEYCRKNVDSCTTFLSSICGPFVRAKPTTYFFIHLIFYHNFQKDESQLVLVNTGHHKIPSMPKKKPPSRDLAVLLILSRNWFRMKGLEANNKKKGRSNKQMPPLISHFNSQLTTQISSLPLNI